MNEQQKKRAREAGARPAQSHGPWTLSRLEILSSSAPNRWPAARVELLHAERGRIWEVGTGAGGLDAAFNAIAQALGLSAPVERLAVHYLGAGAELPEVAAEIRVLIKGERFEGAAMTCDLLTSCLAAYLDALARAERAGSGGPTARPRCSGEQGPAFSGSSA